MDSEIPELNKWEEHQSTNDLLEYYANLYKYMENYYFDSLKDLIVAVKRQKLGVIETAHNAAMLQYGWTDGDSRWYVSLVSISRSGELESYGFKASDGQERFLKLLNE